MKRFLKTTHLYVGQLVTCSDVSDAVVRTIAEIHTKNGVNNAVTLMWSEGERICSQYCFSYVLYAPTVKQIEMSINTWGRLITQADIQQIEDANLAVDKKTPQFVSIA
jgi:hypothetical protein